MTLRLLCVIYRRIRKETESINLIVRKGYGGGRREKVFLSKKKKRIDSHDSSPEVKWSAEEGPETSCLGNNYRDYRTRVEVVT